MMEIDSSKKYQQYNNYVNLYSATNSSSIIGKELSHSNTSNSINSRAISHTPGASFGVSVRQKSNKISEYITPSTGVSTKSSRIPPRYQPTTKAASSTSAIVSPDNIVTKSSVSGEGYRFVEVTERLNSDYSNVISVPSVKIVEPDDDDQVGGHSVSANSSQRKQKQFNSNSSYATFQSTSSQGGGGSRGGHSSATPIVSNRLQQQPSTLKKGSDSTTIRGRTIVSLPKPTKKTSNQFLAVQAGLNNKGKSGLVDRGEEGIQTKSCLTLKVPSVATRSPTVSGPAPTNFVAVGKDSNSSTHSRSLKVKTGYDSDKIGSHSRMPRIANTTSRFGWVRRKEPSINYPGSTSGNISRGATSQASSSVVQIDEVDSVTQQGNHRPARHSNNEVYEDDVEFPPSSSWAESSLASMQSNYQKQRQEPTALPILESSIDTNKNSIPSTLNHIPTTTTPSKQNLKDLLTPPPVQDRGSDRKKIREYELEKRQSRRGLFEGEIEPEGVRGQEATNTANQRKRRGFFAITSTSPTPSPPIPSYGNTGSQQLRPSISSSTTNSSAVVTSRDFVSSTKDISGSSFRVIASVPSESSSHSETKNSKPLFGPFSKLESSPLLAPTNSSISSQDENENDSQYFKECVQDADQTINHKTKPAFHISYEPQSDRTTTNGFLSSNVDNGLVIANSSKNLRENLQRQESNISESTCSDEAIQDMLTDLLPPLEASPSITRGVSRESSTITGGLYISTDESSLENRDLNLIQRHQNSNDASCLKSHSTFYNYGNEASPDGYPTKQSENNPTSNECGKLPISNSPDTSAPVGSTGRGSFDLSIAKNADGVKQILKSSSASSPPRDTSARMRSFDLTSPSTTRLPSPSKGPSITNKMDKSKTSTTGSPGTSTTGDVSSADSPNLSEVDPLNALAVQHVNAGRFDEALLVFTRVLQIHQEINGVNTPNPNTSSAYHNLGTVHAKQAQAYDQASLSAINGELSDEQKILQTQARASALQCFQAAARSARDSLGRNHPNVAVSLVRIGFLLLQSKQYANADTTFSEALRIRLEHYGSEHSLVANLYNNLGVCRMHLGKFEEGLESLEEALKIQHTIISKARDNIVFESGGSRTDKDAQQDERLMSHKLELADTLFNIGGLCLEWIRRDGDKYDKFKQKRRSAQACRAFEEALNIRLSACKNNHNHPSVVQVQNLLRTAEQYKTLQEQQLVHYVSSTSKSPSPDLNSLLVNDHSVETPSSLAKNIQVQTLQFDSPHPMHPESDDGFEDFDKGDNNADELESTPSPKRRGITEFREVVVADTTADTNHEQSHKPRQHPSIFRSLNQSKPQSDIIKVGGNTNNPSSRPPISEVLAVSMETGVDNGAFEVNDDTTPVSKRTSGTRIFVAPHIIPKSSPSRSGSRQGISPGGGRDISDDPAYNSVSLASDQFSPDISDEGNLAEQDDDIFISHKPLLYGHSLKSWSYDGEENCLIRNIGVDSDRGRIHFPLLNNNSIQLTSSQDANDFTANDQQRDIMVTQSIPAVSNRSIQPITSSVDPETPLTSRLSQLLQQNDLKRGKNFESKQWGGSVVDEIMNRARAILDLTNISSMDNDSDDEESMDNEPLDSKNACHSSQVNLSKEIQQNSITPSGSTPTLADVIEEEYLEDGVAPLGGAGLSTQPCPFRKGDIKELLKDPMTCLPELHREASRQLANNNPIDAVHLFETILRCQRRRFGALHPDVASALHNVGLGHLRAQNHLEALKAFEEAARVRKGSLGKDHPLVAVSAFGSVQIDHFVFT
jgi:Tetratricopeptide repeat